MKLFSQSPIHYYEFKKKYKKFVTNIIALSMSSKINPLNEWMGYCDTSPNL